MDTKIVHVHPSSRQVSIRLSPMTVSGIDLLIQLVVLSLLNDPGKAILDIADGGGLPELIGRNLSMEDPQELYAELQQRINKTKTEVLNQQLGLDLEAEEKLRDLTILSVEPGVDESSATVRIRLINEAGRIIDLAV